jgi:hypothetical protein
VLGNGEIRNLKERIKRLEHGIANPETQSTKSISDLIARVNTIATMYGVESVSE